MPETLARMTLTFVCSTHDPADRRSDIGGRQRCRCDLIEQGLEQMIVVTVDERDGKIIVCQRYRRRQPAEAGADNDDPSAVCASFLCDHD